MNYILHIKKCGERVVLKYCNGKNQYIGLNDCDCFNNCSMISNPIKKKVICELTNNVQNKNNCNCRKKCSATQNDLELYFHDYVT